MVVRVNKQKYFRSIWNNLAMLKLNVFLRQHPTKKLLYGDLPPITKTIWVRRTRHAGHCWKSRNELISDVLLWTLSHGRAKAEGPARIYIQQLWEDTGCSPGDQPEAMNDREDWRERVRDIRTDGTTRWWKWWSKRMWGWFVGWVYGISNIVGYLMPNPFYT